MKTRIFLPLSLLFIASLAQAVNSNTQTVKTDRIIVRYHPNPTEGNAMAFIKQGVSYGAFGVAAGKRKDVLEIGAKLHINDVKTLASGLMDDPQVAFAEPDYQLQAMRVPNDPRYNEQWHYYEATAGINLPAAWDITTGSSSVVIAVIDTGIVSHTDIQSNIVSGYDFISSAEKAADGNGRDSNPNDPGDSMSVGLCGTTPDGQQNPPQPVESSWHGTHVAGTIAASSNNGVGVSGVSWGSKVMPLRVLGRCGGYLSDVVDAMRWAAGLSVYNMPANSNPAKVLNLSLGGGANSCPQIFQNAINEITAAGVTVVVAAGNENQNSTFSTPANCNNVISVGAVDRGGDRSYYSNFGSLVDIAAPGGETYINGNGVLSTSNAGQTSQTQDDYEYYQGTSMATPHVAGVAALIYSLRPNITPARLEQLIKSNARAFPYGSNCSASSCGNGILDAAAVLRAVQNEPN